MSGRGITIEQQTELRQYYDAGKSKNAASIGTGLAEATVYRYYTKWKALDDAYNTTAVYSLELLDPKVLGEIRIQARMRGLSLSGFLTVMLTTITEDNLFGAVVSIPDNHPAKKRLVVGDKK